MIWSGGQCKREHTGDQKPLLQIRERRESSSGSTWGKYPRRVSLVHLGNWHRLMGLQNVRHTADEIPKPTHDLTHHIYSEKMEHIHYFFVCVCSYMCMGYVRARVCMCLCTWRPKDNSDGFVIACHLILWDRFSYWTRSLPIHLVWLVSEAQRSFSPCLSSARNTRTYGQAWFFTWILGILTKVLMLARQALYWLLCTTLACCHLLLGGAWQTLRCIS